MAKLAFFETINRAKVFPNGGKDYLTQDMGAVSINGAKQAWYALIGNAKINEKGFIESEIFSTDSLALNSGDLPAVVKQYFHTTHLHHSQIDYAGDLIITMKNAQIKDNIIYCHYSDIKVKFKEEANNEK